MSVINVKESFKDRTAGFWIGFGAGCFMLIVTVVLMALYYSDNVFYHPDDRDKVRMAWLFVFLFAGAVCQLFTVFTDLKFARLLPVVLYALGLGMYFYLAMFPIADAVTGVQFFGGNVGNTVLFLVLIAVGTVAEVASCFMSQRKIS